MAIAGYNPEEAIAFWTLVHTSSEHREASLKAMIPQAKATAAKFGMIYK
jgi:hypothetical protein